MDNSFPRSPMMPGSRSPQMAAAIAGTMRRGSPHSRSGVGSRRTRVRSTARRACPIR